MRRKTNKNKNKGGFQAKKHKKSISKITISATSKNQKRRTRKVSSSPIFSLPSFSRNT
jgi:hypothetical protein